jgi:hypothetical protein
VVRDVVQALKADGIIAVEVPGFDELNRAVLRAAHECIDSTKTPQATLADGTVRRSLAASRSNNEAGPLEVNCAPLAAAEAEFRAAVWSVAEAVAARLGAIDEVEAAAPLLRTRDGAPYATVSDIVRAGDHLEHFHSCHAVRKSNPRPRRDVHYTGTARKARPRKPRSTSTRTRASSSPSRRRSRSAPRTSRRRRSRSRAATGAARRWPSTRPATRRASS